MMGYQTEATKRLFARFFSFAFFLLLFFFCFFLLTLYPFINLTLTLTLTLNPEDVAYALELTYNYNVTAYPLGSGIQEIGITTHDLRAAVKAAEGLGYIVSHGQGSTALNGALIWGPDEYPFRP